MFCISDENGELKGTVSDLSRIRHELELEVRRLEAERNELANALGDSETVSRFSTRFFIYKISYSAILRERFTYGITNANI